MMKHCYLIYLFIKLWRWLCITFNFNRSKYFVAAQLHGHSSRQRRNAFSEGIFHNTENESDHQQYLNFNKFHTIQPNEWLMWEFFLPMRSCNDQAVQSSNQIPVEMIHSSDLLSFRQRSLLVYKKKFWFFSLQKLVDAKGYSFLKALNWSDYITVVGSFYRYSTYRD